MEDIKQRIIKLLAKSGEEKSTTEIALELKEQYWKVLNTLENMERADKTIVGNPSRYWKYWRIKK